MKRISGFEGSVNKQKNDYLNQLVIVRGVEKRRGDLTDEEIKAIEDEEKFMDAVEQAKKSGTMTVYNILN